MIAASNVVKLEILFMFILLTPHFREWNFYLLKIPILAENSNKTCVRSCDFILSIRYRDCCAIKKKTANGYRIPFDVLFPSR